MRTLGNKVKTKDLNAASVSFETGEDHSKTDKLESFFLFALIAPPLDEAASLVLCFTYVWQYTAGFAIRAIRRDLEQHREQKFLDGLKETRAHYLQENRRLRAEHKAARETSSPQVKPPTNKVKDMAVGDLAKHLLTDALLKASTDRFDLDHPDMAGAASVESLLDGEVQDLQTRGLNQSAQDRLFAGKRLANLPDHAAKAVLILLEDNFGNEEVNVSGDTISLTPKAAAAAAAIRRIVISESPELSPDEDYDFLKQRLSTNQRFSDASLDGFVDAAEAANEVDVQHMTREMSKVPSVGVETPPFTR